MLHKRELLTTPTKTSPVVILFAILLALLPICPSSNLEAATQQELSYDDGSPEFGFRAGAGIMAAVLFDAPSTVSIKKLRFYVSGEAESVRVYVLDSSQQPIYSEDFFYPGGTGWFDVDISGASVLVSGRFYAGWMWTSERQCPPCSWLHVDKNGPPYYRSYLGTVGNLKLVKDVPEDGGVRQENYMIRVVLDTPYQSSIQLGPEMNPGCVHPPFTTTIFFQNTVSFNYIGGRVILSSTPDGTGSLSTDDEVKIMVTRPDGSTATFNYVFGYPKHMNFVETIPPQDVTDLFKTGTNIVFIQYIDNSQCAGSTAYFLVRVSDQTPGTQGNLVHFDLDYRGTPPNFDGNDQHSVTVPPGTTLTLFFRYNEGNAGNQYVIRVYPEWDKSRFIANSDDDEAPYGEVGQEISGYRWDREAYTVPTTPGTYRVRVVYSASATPPTWDRYDRLLAEGTITVSRPAIIPTSLTITLDPSSIPEKTDKTIKVSGRLTRKDTGQGIAGKKIDILFSDWPKTAFTDSNGYYQTDYTVNLRAGSSRFEASFAGDSDYGVSSAMATLTVTPAQFDILDITTRGGVIYVVIQNKGPEASDIQIHLDLSIDNEVFSRNLDENKILSGNNVFPLYSWDNCSGNIHHIKVCLTVSNKTTGSLLWTDCREERWDSVHIKQIIEKGFQFLANLGLSQPSRLPNVVYPADKNQYLPSIDTIRILCGDVDNVDTIFHEFAHFIEDKWYLQNMPFTEICAKYQACAPSDAICAMKEGWAEFFSALATVEESYFPDSVAIEVQDPFYACRVRMKGQENEKWNLGVAGILWDLYDGYSGSEPFDNISIPIKDLILLIKDSMKLDSKGLRTVYDNFKIKYPSYAREIDKLLKDGYGIDYSAVPTLGDIVFIATGPVEVIITDPDGYTINRQLTQISDASYTEADLDSDGDIDAHVFIPNRKEGDYQVRVVPKPGAVPSDTYSLEVWIDGNVTNLANKQQIKDISAVPYTITSITSRKESLSIEKAVAAHSGDPTLIEDIDIQWAIQLWISSEEVPGTDGQVIDDRKMQELIQLWISGQRISSASAQDEPVLAGKTERLMISNIELFPNPVRSTSTATLKVNGSGIAAVKLEIFSLAGVKVFEQEALGTTLRFNALDNEGGLLANGVYLYIVTVKGFDGKIKRSRVEKLVILR